MTKRAAILKSKNEETVYRVHMRLQEGRTAMFEYSDRPMAREHFDFLRATGLVGGFAIKDIRFEEHAVKS